MIEFTEVCDGCYSPGQRFEFANGMEALYVERKVAKYVDPLPPEPSLPEPEPLAGRRDKMMKPERAKRKGE